MATWLGGGSGVTPAPTFERVMITTAITINLPPQSGHGRSEGLHLSKIIKNIALENGALDPEYADDLSLVEVSGRQEAWWNSLDPSVRLKMSMGLAWEDWYVPQLECVAYHPGEMQVDGIYMTHDGESLDFLMHKPTDLELALHEVKLTYKSENTVGNLTTQYMWLAQTKGYCKGLGTRVAYLHVLFACGDYSYPIRPTLRCWRIDYTQDEIDANWEDIIAYVKHRQEQEG